MKIKLLAAAFFVALGSIAAPHAAFAASTPAPCVIPYPNTPALTSAPSPSQIWANFNQLASCASLVNVPSNMVPQNQAQATVGGAYQWIFPNGIAWPARTAPSASILNGPVRTVYNLVNYGADPNDVLDSEPAFQAAANAAAANGGCVYIPFGNYLLSESVTLKQPGPCVFGDGAFSSVLHAPGSSYNVLQGSATTSAANTNTAPILRDFAIDHDTPATGGGDFVFANATDVTLENVYTYGSYDVYDLGQPVANIVDNFQIKNVWNFNVQHCWADPYAGIGNLTISNANVSGAGPNGISRAWCQGLAYAGAPTPSSPNLPSIGIGVLSMDTVDLEYFNEGIHAIVGAQGQLTDSNLNKVFVDTIWDGPALWIATAPNSQGNLSRVKISQSAFLSREDGVRIDGNGATGRIDDISFDDVDAAGGLTNPPENGCGGTATAAGFGSGTISGTPVAGNTVTAHFTPNGGATTTVTYTVTSADVAASDPITSVATHFAAAINASSVVTVSSGCPLLAPVYTDGGAIDFSTTVLDQSGGPLAYYFSSNSLTVSPTSATNERTADAWRVQGGAQNVHAVALNAYGAANGSGIHIGNSIGTEVSASDAGPQQGNNYGIWVDASATGYKLNDINACYNVTGAMMINTAYGNSGAPSDDWISGIKCGDPIGSLPVATWNGTGGENFINPYPYDCVIYYETPANGGNVTGVSIINATGTATSVQNNGVLFVPRGGGFGFNVSNNAAPVGEKVICN